MQMQTAADFIAAFDVEDFVKAAQLERVFHALMPWLQKADSAEVRTLATALLQGDTRWNTALSDVLAWLADEDWPGLIALAVQRLQASGSMSVAVRTVLECASYQQPQALQPYAQQLQSQEDLDFECFEPDVSTQYAQAAMHLIFPAFYLKKAISWIPTHWHPSWNLQPQPGGWRFGGAGQGDCRHCGGPLQHLISLPKDKVYGQPCKEGELLHLQLCLSCMESGVGELHYRHDAQGLAHCLNEAEDGQLQEPDNECGPLRAAEVALADTPERWQRQDWGQSNGRENLYRVGGQPSWIQSPWVPLCKCCGQEMWFVLQLGSEMPQADSGVEHYWGSGGMLYAFACPPCGHSAYITQYT